MRNENNIIEKSCPRCGHVMKFKGDVFECVHCYNTILVTEGDDIEDSFEQIFYEFLKGFNSIPFIVDTVPQIIWNYNKNNKRLENRLKVLLKQKDERK